MAIKADARANYEAVL